MPANLKKGFLFFLLICGLVSEKSFAQQSKADSLKRIMGFNHDAREVGLKFALCDAYLNYSPSKAVETANEARAMAVELSSDSLEAEAVLELGKVNYKLGRTTDALANYDDAATKFNKLGYTSRAAYANCSAGELYSSAGKYNEALTRSLDSYKLFENAGDKRGMSKALILSGLVYRSMKNYNKSLSDFNKALLICRENGLKDNEAVSLLNMSNVYADLHQHDSVYILLNEALEIDKQLDDKYSEGNLMNNIGTAYLDDSILDKAESYFDQALEIFKQIGDKPGQAVTLTNLGVMEYAREDWDKALSYFNRALELAKDANAGETILVLYQNIAETYGNKGDYESALPILNKALDLKDTIFNKNLTESTAEMQARFDVEKAQADYTASQKQKKLIVTGAIIGGILLVIILFFFVNRAAVRKRTNIKLNAQKEEIEQKNSELHDANQEIELKNKDITDSILYASRIQEAILPEVEFFNTFHEKGFVLYRPKDIVSGDFYWMAQTSDYLLFAAVDCTGHGVPGAFMSIVCSNLLTQAVKEHGLIQPNEILNDVNIRLSETLRQRQDESRVRDGMDIALCSINKKNKMLLFAGAYNPVWIVRNGALTELLADKFPVGLFLEEELKKFQHQEFQLQKGDRIYVASDGYSDQFGGELGKKFKRSSFTQLLLSFQDKPILEHKTILKKAHLEWKGKYDQIDDVLVMGIEIV